MSAWLPCIVAMLLACDEGDDAPPTAPQPETPPAAAPAEEPSPTEQLAREIHRAAGGERLNEVAQLDFTFVVQQDGSRAFEATHRWDRTRERDRVTFTDREGRRIDALVDLPARMACGTIDGEIAAGDRQQELSEQAYGRWVNDAYWLMMPLKLQDPGVRLAREAPREHAGKRYEVLALSFERVGLTPGDRYWLFVDPDTHLVVRWEMALEGQEGPPKAMSWTDHREVGPLTLAFDHATDDGTRHVGFEDVVAHPSARPADFQVEGCPED